MIDEKSIQDLRDRIAAEFQPQRIILFGILRIGRFETVQEELAKTIGKSRRIAGEVPGSGFLMHLHLIATRAVIGRRQQLRLR